MFQIVVLLYYSGIKMSHEFTLKDGHYKITQGFIPVVKVDGLLITYEDLREDIEKTKSIKYGKVENIYINFNNIISIQFHDIDEDLIQKFGQTYFNIKISHTFASYTLDEFGVVEESGLKARFYGMGGIYQMELVSENEAKNIGRYKFCNLHFNKIINSSKIG